MAGKKELQKKGQEKVVLKEVISNDYDIFKSSNKCFEKVVLNLKIISNDDFETAITYEINTQ